MQVRKKLVHWIRDWQEGHTAKRSVFDTCKKKIDASPGNLAGVIKGRNSCISTDEPLLLVNLTDSYGSMPRNLLQLKIPYHTDTLLATGNSARYKLKLTTDMVIKGAK